MNTRESLQLNNTTQHLLLIVFLSLMGIMLLTACGLSDEDRNQNQTFTVAIIQVSPVFDQVEQGMKDHLAQQGFVEGENINFITVRNYTYEAIEEVVETAQVDVFVTIPGDNDLWQPVKELRDLVPDTPIVFVLNTSDPIEQGYADNLTQPGGNITGITLPNFDQKRFQLLLDLVPDAKRIYVPYDPATPAAIEQIPVLQTTAQTHGVELVLLEAPDAEPEVTVNAISEFPDDIDAIFLLKVWVTSLRWYQAGYDLGIPVSQEGAASLGNIQPVMAYGPDMYAIGTQTARFVDQILDGTKAGELPIESVDYFLTIDLGMAEAIDLWVPDTLLEQANVVTHTDVANIISSSADSEGVASVGTCTANFTSPGGTNSICATTACDSLRNDSFVSYSDKTDVDSCEADTFVGLCSTDAFDTYYYDGDPATLKIGCSFASGIWTEGEN